MNVLSDPRKDVRHRPHSPGGYEWWYFDALSRDGRYGFVIIFYEGNPFSTRYNRALLKGQNPMPSDHPAISISVYDNGVPVYYSFTEFEEKDCFFSEDRPLVKAGSHRMEEIGDEEKLKYRIFLDETLADGSCMEATIFFESRRSPKVLIAEGEEKSKGHRWNLVQPGADVEARMQISVENEDPDKIEFEGKGYHDHNTGSEPMRDEFSDWYWGRVHFDYATLVYYVMNRRDEEQHRAWLISSDNGEVLDVMEEVELADKGLTFFGLKTARKIGLRSNRAEVQVQLSRLLDNGPFYRRYGCDAFLNVGDQHVESATGISEYIRPDRIFSRTFWPFVDMRIRYKAEKPHWVQRSKRLYRWTW